MDLIITPEATPANVPLAGRVLMLDTSKQPRFQCGGFIVTRNSPISIVSRNAVEVQVRRGLEQKILIDITGRDDLNPSGKVVNDIDQAVKDGTLAPLKDEEVGPKILIGTDAKGNSYVIIPKDDQDYEALQKELRENGFIRRAKPAVNNFSGLSPVFLEDIPPEGSQT